MDIMISGALEFLKANQAILSWIGGGIGGLAIAIWTVIKFFVKRRDRTPVKAGVSADHGSMAAGRDIHVNARGSSSHSKTPR